MVYSSFSLLFRTAKNRNLKSNVIRKTLCFQFNFIQAGKKGWYLGPFHRTSMISYPKRQGGKSCCNFYCFQTRWVSWSLRNKQAMNWINNNIEHTEPNVLDKLTIIGASACTSKIPALFSVAFRLSSRITVRNTFILAEAGPAWELSMKIT